MDQHHGEEEERGPNEPQRVPDRWDPGWRAYLVFDAETLRDVCYLIFFCLSPIWVYWLAALIHLGGNRPPGPYWWEFVLSTLVGLLIVAQEHIYW